MSLEESAESDEAIKSDIERPNRYTSHALVEVRRFKILPFFCYSAVLLDISISGFKIEFTSDTKVEPGSRYWLNIPLGPLGIFAPKRLLVQAETRWFDSDRFRIGGVFMNLTHTEKMIVEHIIQTIEARKGVSSKSTEDSE